MAKKIMTQTAARRIQSAKIKKVLREIPDLNLAL